MADANVRRVVELTLSIARQKPRRAERMDIRRAREALKLVLPIHRQIGAWQSQAARLVAFGTKLRSAGRSEPRLTAEAEALSRAIEAQRRRLQEQMSALPPEIATHGRFIDTVRALDSVSVGVSRAMSLLNGGRDATDVRN
jgi:hypothetical protein